MSEFSPLREESDIEGLLDFAQMQELTITDAELLKQVSPDEAEFFLELADILVTDLDWENDEASRYVLNWVARSYFDLPQPEVLE